MRNSPIFLLSALLIVTTTALGQATNSAVNPGAPALATAHMGIKASEFQARRQAVMNAVSDEIVLLHSFSAPKSWSDSGFQQDSNFYYLTGLENLHDAILALDGTTKETWLFVKA
jgi:hypothetical protein